MHFSGLSNQHSQIQKGQQDHQNEPQLKNNFKTIIISFLLFWPKFIYSVLFYTYTFIKSVYCSVFQKISNFVQIWSWKFNIVKQQKQIREENNLCFQEQGQRSRIQEKFQIQQKEIEDLKTDKYQLTNFKDKLLNENNIINNQLSNKTLYLEQILRNNYTIKNENQLNKVEMKQIKEQIEKFKKNNKIKQTIQKELNQEIQQKDKIISKCMEEKEKLNQQIQVLNNRNKIFSQVITNAEIKEKETSLCNGRLIEQNTQLKQQYNRIQQQNAHLNEENTKLQQNNPQNKKLGNEQVHQ